MQKINHLTTAVTLIVVVILVVLAVVEVVPVVIIGIGIQVGEVRRKISKNTEKRRKSEVKEEKSYHHN